MTDKDQPRRPEPSFGPDEEGELPLDKQAIPNSEEDPAWVKKNEDQAKPT